MKRTFLTFVLVMATFGISAESPRAECTLDDLLCAAQRVQQNPTNTDETLTWIYAQALEMNDDKISTLCDLTHAPNAIVREQASFALIRYLNTKPTTANPDLPPPTCTPAPHLRQDLALGLKDALSRYLCRGSECP